MRAEIIGVGTELLLGDVVNSNAAWLGRELAAIGVDVEHTTAVGDNIPRIAGAIRAAADRADAVIVTGGLGPTQDDLTREALAEAAASPLVRDAEVEAGLLDRYRRTGRSDFPTNNLRMADRPDAARPLPNSAGTAPGLRIGVGPATVYALPGVPTEMQEIFTAWVKPELAARAGAGAVLVSRAVRTVGIWESEVATLLADLDAELGPAGNPTIAYLASEGQTRVRITAKATSEARARELIEPVEQRVRAALGDVVFGADEETLEGVVHQMLLSAGATVATAESLTGGLLGAALSATPGASSTYLGGVVAYATAVKSGMLGVDATLLAQRGAVDPDVALAMADAARRALDATYGLATTGVAGPTEQDGVPVGTVFVALSGGAQQPVVRRLQLGAGVPGAAPHLVRARIRRTATQTALDLLRRRLCGLPAE